MSVIKYEHIRILQHNIGNGVTEPKFATTDNNKQVIVKLLNGPEGNRVLFNEYFCYRLAILLDMEMPISGICSIDECTENLNDDIDEQNWGFGFYSTYMAKVVPLVESIIPLIKNKSDFYKILLFDHMIFNPDRNAGNLLVQYYKSNISLKVIDHTHVFINQAIWDSQCLTRGMKEKDYLSTKILEYNDYLYGMFFRNLPSVGENLKKLIAYFREKITYDIMTSIVEEIPESWLPSQKDINTLIKYVLYRVEHLEDICITIEEFLKK